MYVDTDDDVRLARRIQRDVAFRGRDIKGVIEQYTRFVKPAFDTFIGPSRRCGRLSGGFAVVWWPCLACVLLLDVWSIARCAGLLGLCVARLACGWAVW